MLKGLSLKSETLEEMQKSMIRNFLDTIILAELRKSSPLSGYDVMDFIHKKFDALISSGTVYSLLYSMERKGLIKSEETGRKRVYRLTDKGRETINTILNSKEKIHMCLGTIIGG
jgi:DNA-binding PadR family transcriptional regulator